VLALPEEISVRTAPLPLLSPDSLNNSKTETDKAEEQTKAAARR
jgi:hypothetical protein